MMGIEWQADPEHRRPFRDPARVKERAVALGTEAVATLGGPASTRIWIPPSNMEDGAMDHLLTVVEAIVVEIEREFSE